MGKQSQLWNQAWLAPDMVITNLNVNIPSAMQNALVVDLVNETGDWNLSELTHWLHAYLVLRLRSFPPPSREYGHDEMMRMSKHGARFVVSDMYNILCEFNNIEDSERWNKAWKLRVPERVRSFVW
jgi:hypothetical protein